MLELKFTVDSALLRELGERLVGKPHIALAELVKNGYDADATDVRIELSQDQDRIIVHDSGHGMTFEQFRDFWMRIGTPHKDESRVSEYCGRHMTGSKGVGRLSAQFLASRLKLITVPGDPTKNGSAVTPVGSIKWLEASVNWDEAVKAGELTSATVEYSLEASDPPFPHGTSVILSGLKQLWDQQAIQELAREIWWLQPPFRGRAYYETEAKDAFEIKFVSSEREFEKVFRDQLRTILDIWTARLVGKNDSGKVTLSLEFEGQAPVRYDYSIADFPHNLGSYYLGTNLHNGNFEIRVYTLKYRQPAGIKVDEAREYFWKHGGVHVFDGGFRLPFYGDPKNDWLSIEFDHSHRRFVSELLPKELKEQYGADTGRLNFLPTLGRLFGVVNVSTSAETGLDILITRDRLNESSTAFKDLVTMVRYALDLYAYEEGRRHYENNLKKAKTFSPGDSVEGLEESLERHRDSIPEEAYRELREGVSTAQRSLQTEQEVFRSQMGIMGSLATAGIAAVAYQHELRKQFITIESIVERVENIGQTDPRLKGSLELLAADLRAWLKRARATMGLFEFVADAENVQERRRQGAAYVLKEVKRQTEFLARGMDVRIASVPENLLLPSASLAEWGAIFQNVFTNAFNAMLDSDRRLLQVSASVDGLHRAILVQDTGQGVDLAKSDELFSPFKRQLKISPERQALGYGGTGLGLTIVRLVAQRIGCEVGFVEPEEGFSTAFSLSWRESK